MPFTSKKQMRWMYAAADRGEIDADMPHRWAHHTKNLKALPEKANAKAEKKGSMTMIAEAAKKAAEIPMVAKLAADVQTTPEVICYFAKKAECEPIDFVKLAYADPDGFLNFTKAILKLPFEKKAASGFFQRALTKLKSLVPEGVRHAVSEARKPAQEAPLKPRMVDQSAGSNMVTKAVGKFSPIGGSQAGRAATIGGLGAGGAGIASGLSGDSTPKAPTPPKAPKPQDAAPSVATGNQGGNKPVAGQQQPKPGGGGMTPAAKMMMAGGAGAAAGAGLGVMAGRKKKNQKQANDLRSRAIDVMRHILVKRATATHRKEAAAILCGHLNVVAQKMPLEKTAGVRTIQREVAQGKSLSHAIKLAYPQLPGEQRGILASKLVHAAVEWKKKANMMSMGPGPGTAGVPTQEAQTFNGPVDQGMSFMGGM